ncbi:glycoside hydrolase family 95-like protein [Paenibacillus sp. FSL H7-0331]|uniref:glycosyl hydrolase family 95 catalytic domain-containing protein n=1 Tax=Paenibacillus sp. FSL H7-0331 TaxID=1920421 RepID=UPI00096FF8AA|nr:hypothetical protein [Paenibacillus sp. FSL H7-0331]OMF12355.1 hypothetical protein BK127_23080 [Paenibacillus sp. FSL H7-0331]
MHNQHLDGIKLDLDWESYMGNHDMEWVVKPVSWDEGAFIGNGNIGAMIYGEEHSSKRRVLRFIVGRTDITATRTDSTGFSPRVPIGELHLELEGMIYHPSCIRVDLWNAEASAVLTTTRGEVRLRALAHSEEAIMAVEIETSEGEHGANFVWYPYPEVDPVLINADGINLNQYIPKIEVERKQVIQRNESSDTKIKIGTEGRAVPGHAADVVEVCIQRYSQGAPVPQSEGCVSAWNEVQLSPNQRIYYLSIEKGHDEQAQEQVVQHVMNAVSQSFDEWVAAHRAWWHRYYQRSLITIPDARLESFYWIQMYKLASATRADRPLIDNQGPWLAPTPWAGVWFNMNVQLSYSPVYTANRLDIGESLVRTLAACKEQLIANVSEPYRDDSAGLGRSCSYDLRSEVGDEVGNLTWICHNVWRQYRYSMDETLLREMLFPLLRRSINFYFHLLEEAEDGKLHLPPTISPEYGSFMKTKVRDCHYDLALLRWGCETLLWMCERLEVTDPLRDQWVDVLERLTPFPIDETGLMVGRDTPLAYGHRHFSHLLAVFPLHLIGSDSSEDRALIARSLEHWIGKEGDLRGFSFTGAASIAATLGRGDEALGYLQTLLHIIKPNTMYKEAGPVMETPLAGAESLQDMLLQSWGDTIRIFPAVPTAWREAAFHDLRTEGAFLVSAQREDGNTRFIRVKSLAGEPCKIKTGWSGAVNMMAIGPASAWSRSESHATGVVELQPDERGVVELSLVNGDEVVLYQGDTVPDLVIHAAAQIKEQPIRYFGGHKPWRVHATR